MRLRRTRVGLYNGGPGCRRAQALAARQRRGAAGDPNRH